MSKSRPIEIFVVNNEGSAFVFKDKLDAVQYATTVNRSVYLARVPKSKYKKWKRQQEIKKA